MCSINEEDLDTVSLKLDMKYQCDLKYANCKKCSQEKASVVLRTKDAYCRACFLKYATHKFRATLGKSKLVKPKDRILIASSGSQSSVTLLHLVAEGLSEHSNKRFLFTPMVVYIDEGAIVGLSREECIEAITLNAMQVKNYNFPFYTVQLSNSLNMESIRILNFNSEGEGIDLNEPGIRDSDAQLISLFNAATTLTAKEDLLGKLRQNLLMAVAKELRCNKVFLADNGSQLAVNLISNVSVGRGACLPWDTGFCDMRDPAVMILRPLKEFMSKEIAFYCIFNKLTAVTLPSVCTKASRMASIRRLTEDFLCGLHLDFPSTFSSVIKIGDKLAPPMEVQERCILCKVTLDEQLRQCSSQLATQFSKELISQINSEAEILLKGCLVGNDEPSEISCSSEAISEEALARQEGGVRRKVEDYSLCYGCRLIMTDMENAEKFLEGLSTVGSS